MASDLGDETFDGQPDSERGTAASIEAELRKVEDKILALAKRKKSVPPDVEVHYLRLQAALAPPDKKAALSLQVAKLLDVRRDAAAAFSIDDLDDSVLRTIARFEKSRVGYSPKAMGYA